MFFSDRELVVKKVYLNVRVGFFTQPQLARMQFSVAILVLVHRFRVSSVFDYYLLTVHFDTSII